MQRLQTTDQDGFAVRALDPALNGRVCRAPDQQLNQALGIVATGLVMTAIFFYRQ